MKCVVCADRGYVEDMRPCPGCAPWAEKREFERMMFIRSCADMAAIVAVLALSLGLWCLWM
jgi:hypothetical protein